MRIAYASDLHLERLGGGWPCLHNSNQAEVLILAGDVWEYATIHNHKRFIDYISNEYELVLLVEGNHEWYNYNIRSTFNIEAFFPNNVVLLKNNVFKHKDVSFYGGSMWCNPREFQVMDEFVIRNAVNCFKKINSGSRNLNFDDVQEFYDEFMEGLYTFDIVTQGKKVVVSHFAPSMKSVSPLYKNSSTNQFFCNNIDDFLASSGINFYIHGHVHSRHDYMIGNTNVLCNPHGYKGELSGFELKYFDI